MAFTPTNLSTVPLLETTFISDMRLIVNANTALLRTQIEDVVNDLEIDLINKAIGVDNPIGSVFSESLVLSSQLLFKDSSASSANTIASLTRTAGESTFSVDNLAFTTEISSTEAGSYIATPTVVIGTTNGAIGVTVPSTGGITDKGLYVGDAVTPIKASFYGETTFAKQAITNSSVSREISLTANGTSYTYANLNIARTDSQFIYLTLKMPSGYSQTTAKPIWLFLHEDFTTALARPAVGQTFTIIIDALVNSDGTQIATSSWPQISNTLGSAGINIVSGFTQDSTAGSGKLKSGYVNYAIWPSLPLANAAAAISAISTTQQYVRFFNQYSQNTTVPRRRGSSISFTKTEQLTNYSHYTITSSSNSVILN